MTHDILVVDDDADIREAIELVLEMHGYKVTTANDGAEALARLQAGARPALILLDLMMPVMSGVDFRVAQLRDPAIAKIPVVVLSGNTHTAERLAAFESDVLKKPIALNDLVELVSRYCGDVASG